MPQGILPYKYEEEKKSAGMTVPAGLPLYLDLVCALCLPKSIEGHRALRPLDGYPDGAVAHAPCPRRRGLCRGSEGFRRILGRIEPEVSPSRWRIEKSRTVPSPSSVFRYLSAFHTDEAPVRGSAFPACPSRPLPGQPGYDCLRSTKRPYRNPRHPYRRRSSAMKGTRPTSLSTSTGRSRSF